MIAALVAAYFFGAGVAFLAACRVASADPNRHADDFSTIAGVTLLWPVAVIVLVPVALVELIASAARMVTRRMAARGSKLDEGPYR